MTSFVNRSSDRRRRGLALGVGAVLAWGLIAKSVLFIDAEPVLMNYSLTSGLLVLLGLAALTVMPAPVERTTGVLCVAAISWAALSAVLSGISLNIAAVLTFSFLLVGFGLILPVILWHAGVESWRLINALLTAGTLLSLVLVLVPELSYDPISGRFRGAYVSVAVACTMFGFNAYLAIQRALHAKGKGQRILWLLIAIVAAYFLYETRTRSSLAEFLAAALICFMVAPLTRIVRYVVVLIAGIGLFITIIGLSGVVTGNEFLDEELLGEFRLEDATLTDARGGNWEFGIERIIARPLLGEGLLAKQTQGGGASVDLNVKSNYDPRYDPHSLLLSTGVQAGLPFTFFMFAIFIYVPSRFVSIFGLRQALNSPEFVLVTLRLSTSLLSGGDMTALGNIVDKLTWLMIGIMAVKIELRSPRWRAHGRRVGRSLPTAPAAQLRHPGLIRSPLR